MDSPSSYLGLPCHCQSSTTTRQLQFCSTHQHCQLGFRPSCAVQTYVSLVKCLLIHLRLLSNSLRMQRYGPRALTVAQHQKARSQRLEDFRRTVEKRLRIRQLARDPSLQEEQFISCCKRMLHNSDSLSQICDGLSLRISHINQVWPDGSGIDVAWDFEV